MAPLTREVLPGGLERRRSGAGDRFYWRKRLPSQLYRAAGQRMITRALPARTASEAREVVDALNEAAEVLFPVAVEEVEAGGDAREVLKHAVNELDAKLGALKREAARRHADAAGVRLRSQAVPEAPSSGGSASERSASTAIEALRELAMAAEKLADALAGSTVRAGSRRRRGEQR